MIEYIARPAAFITRREPYGVECAIRGFVASLFRREHGVRIGRDVIFVNRRAIHFGEGVTLFGFSYFNAFGTSGLIRIGRRTHVDVNAVFYGQGGLEIGDDCAIAAGVTIYTQSNQYEVGPSVRVIDQPVRYAPVVIGTDVWIGAGAIVLPGITVADHAVIGAGAVVNRDVQSFEIVGGVPAHVIGNRKKLG